MMIAGWISSADLGWQATGAHVTTENLRKWLVLAGLGSFWTPRNDIRMGSKRARMALQGVKWAPEVYGDGVEFQ